MTRGEGVDKDYDRFRDVDYFRRYDTNAVVDDELAIKSGKAQLP